jgi:hypothetical protein
VARPRRSAPSIANRSVESSTPVVAGVRRPGLRPSDRPAFGRSATERLKKRPLTTHRNVAAYRARLCTVVLPTVSS